MSVIYQCQAYLPVTYPYLCMHIVLLLYRDIERLESPTYSVKAHDGIINTIDGCGGLGIGGGAPEIVTGGRDGRTEGAEGGMSGVYGRRGVRSVRGRGVVVSGV